MATRSGSVDPGALLYSPARARAVPEELDERSSTNPACRRWVDSTSGSAFQVYTYRIAQAVASMAVALGGIDVLAFSGGVGEHREDVRRAIADQLRFLGEIEVEVVPAQEDLVVAASVKALLAGNLA